MPEPKLSRLAATVFCNPDQLPLQPSRRRNRKRPHKRTKRYHRAFRLPIALGLYPTKQRQCDPFGLRLSTMHIMESECEKSGGILTAEGAPEIGTKANGVVIAEEALENGSGVLSPENKTIREEPPGQEEPGGTEEEQEEPGGTEDEQVLDEPANEEAEGTDDVEGIDEVGTEELEETEVEEAEAIEETEALEEADLEEETVAEGIEESDAIGIEEVDASEEPIEDSEAIEEGAMEDAEGIDEEPALEEVGDLEANETLKDTEESDEAERIEADGLVGLEETNEAESEALDELPEAESEALDELPEAESAEPASTEVPLPEPSQPEPTETNEEVPTVRPEPEEKMDIVPTPDEVSNVAPVSHVRETPSVSPTPSLPKENGISSPTTSPKLSSTPKEEKEDSEEEDKHRIINKLPEVQIEKVRKRSLDGEASSSSESDSTKKRLRHQEPTNTPHPPDHPGHGEDERESSIQKFIESCAQSIEEINMASEKLQKEMSALSELAKAKEIEWNSILRLRKLKEEMFERLQRKKREVQVLEGKFSDEFYHHNPFVNQMVLQMQRQNKELSPDSTSISNPWGGMGNMMGLQVNPMLARIPDLSKQQRPILPKPFHPAMDHSSMREGRNGPILDVKSIIADYSGRRSRHGGEAPPGRQRGRRRGLMPGQMEAHPQGPGPGLPPRHVSSSPSLISMANMALGTAFSVRTYDPPPPPYPPIPMGVQERVGGDHNNTHSANANHTNPGATSFKEALVQFAKLGPGGRGAGNYPEVTLHPVGAAGMGQPLHPPTSTSHPPHHISQQPPHPSNQSLLHGILTKTPVPAHTKQAPTTFSPTLARLLTAPDQHHGRQHLALPQHQQHHAQPAPHPNPHPQPAHQNSYHRPNPVNINEILASKKSRTDITITPVSSSNNATPKPKEEVVLLQDEDEEGSTGDRLVIDEGPDGTQEEVPQCQGCRQKPAQFVCAGCGNQWYCSRECQVTAWEEHSDVCSG